MIRELAHRRQEELLNEGISTVAQLGDFDTIDATVTSMGELAGSLYANIDATIAATFPLGGAPKVTAKRAFSF